MRLHSLGTDRWDVWACRVPADSTSVDFEGAVGGRIPVDASGAAKRLRRAIAPYFRHLSQGRYRQRFRARGTIGLGRAQGLDGCEKKAVRRSRGRDGAILVTNIAGGGPVSASADACADQAGDRKPRRACAGRPRTLPGNGRVVRLDGGDLFGGLPGGPHLATAAHELGHSLAWPHSFTGHLYIPYAGEDGTFEIGISYDDPFDLMGYERLWGTGSWTSPADGDYRLKGTQAFNRYAAGWMRRSAVAVQRRKAATYRIAPIGRPGTQLVLVPTASRRAFVTIEARVRRGHDRNLPFAGVDVHAIDQRGSACTVPGFVSNAACWGESRRQVPLPPRADSLASMIRPGSGLRVAGLRIRNLGRAAGGGFRVRVIGRRATLPPTVPEGCMDIPGICGPTGR